MTHTALDPDTQHLVLEYLAAAAAGDLDGVHRALESGAPIDARGRRRETAVLRAAKAGHYNIVRALIAAGADIDLQDDTSLNPFLYGCINGDLELVRIAVEAGTNLELLTRFGGNGLTPAAEKGHVDIVEYLVTRTDINVNLTNTIGWTALIEAVILGDGGATQQRIIELLLAHDADPGLTDEWGVTPLELARQKGFSEIERLLEAAGAAA